MVKTYPDGLKQINVIAEEKKDHDEVGDIYGTLIDLGTAYLYDRLAIYSTLDQDVTLKIGSSEITVLSNTTRAFDGFDHNGIVSWKYTSVQPISGTLQLISY